MNRNTKKVTQKKSQNLSRCRGLSLLGLFVPMQAWASTLGDLSLNISSPLRPEINSIEALLLAILNILIILATPIVVFFVIYAGFLYVTASGNAEQVKQANRALTYAIIGGILIIGAIAIAGIIKTMIAPFTA